MTADALAAVLSVDNAVPGYRSPYSMLFDTTAAERMAGFDQAPWCTSQAQ